MSESVSWHLYDSEAPSGPLDVWLIDSEAVATRITTASDWCLIVETSEPFAGYDTAKSGRVEVAPISGETPFTDHLGETTLAVSDRSNAPHIDRQATGVAPAAPTPRSSDRPARAEHDNPPARQSHDPPDRP
ncbi:hypothetical protein ACH4ZU_08785 [Streptomyces sp. NPDC020472]|uniref:hypothetical protein n=1 Tax=Streptomyces sp. NPDC020472 TaxID=3365075 RepID=UPI0037BC2A2B